MGIYRPGMWSPFFDPNSEQEFVAQAEVNSVEYVFPEALLRVPIRVRSGWFMVWLHTSPRLPPVCHSAILL